MIQAINQMIKKMVGYTKLTKKWLLSTLSLDSDSLKGIGVHHSESEFIIINLPSTFQYC